MNRNIPILCLTLLGCAATAPVPRPPSPAASSASNEERDPAEQRRFDHRRGDMVRARHWGRQFLALGRQMRDPLLILSAAQLFQQSPPPRPLTRAGAPGVAPLASGAPALDTPGVEALWAEARGLAEVRPGPLEQATRALIEGMERSAVTVRGAVLGPQRICDRMPPGMRLNYDIAYDGRQQAVVAVASDGPGALVVTVSDLSGRIVGRTPDRALLSWYPREHAIYLVSLENRTEEAITFCLETN